MFPPDKNLPLRRRISVEIITPAQARYVLMQWHYLRRTRSGPQLHYAVLVDGAVDGVITFAYPLVTQPIAGVERGAVLEFARLFLYSNTPHSATCAIGKALRRVRVDWKNAHPTTEKIELIVAWSDRHYHKGTIYRAANFQWLRESEGKHSADPRSEKYWRGRVVHADQRHKKDCWIYRLPEEVKHERGKRQR